MIGLKHSLLSVNQICDRGHDVIFMKYRCEIRRTNNGRLVVVGIRTLKNLYILIETSKGSCFLGKEDEDWLWHKRLGHISFDNLIKINSKKTVRDIPSIGKPLNNIFSSCQKGNLIRSTFKTKGYYSSKPLELVHTNFCGHMRA